MNRRWARIALTLALLTLYCTLTDNAGASVRAEETQPPALASAVAATAPEDVCRALAAQLAEQNQKTRHELRLIKRDLALLNQNLEKPGWTEILAGIGYILGLFGIAAFVAARRQNTRAQGD